MYLVENNCRKPQYNLALEEHLCNLAIRRRESFFMFWQNEPAIIVGRFQNTLSEINARFVAERNIHVVRRNSGGGAVYHDLGNVNYSFVMPSLSDCLDFSALAAPIVEVLREMGVPAESSGRNDITANGRKISGAAQYRRGGVVLHHGTLLFNSDLEVLSQALNAAPDKFAGKGVQSVRARVGNIVEYLPSPIGVSEFSALAAGRVEEVKCLTRMSFSDLDSSEVARLEREKYSSWDWNYGSSPGFAEHKAKRFPWGKAEAFIEVRNGAITAVEFRGDFFGSADFTPLNERLNGCLYTKKAVKKALLGLNTSNMFAGSLPEDICSLLSPEI